MPSIKDILTTNILMPSHDGLPESNPLTAYDAASKIEAVNELSPSETSFSYDLYLKISDKESENFVYLQEVTGFGMNRENESRPSSNKDYVINLPGPISYSDIKIKHLYTNDKFFLNWLNNGVTSGGASRVDMELHFILPTKKKIIFTLQDAFPTGWKLGPLNVKGEDVLIETITITFSGMAYQSIDIN